MKTQRLGRLAGYTLAFLALITSSLAAAQNSIEAFNVGQQAGRVVVQITLKEPLAAAPANFSVANPARIAFDFPRTTNNLGRATQEIGEGDLRSMNMVQVGD